MKILVTGSNGMLGWGLKQVLPSTRTIFTDIETLNINDVDAFDKYKDVGCIVHAAAITDHHEANTQPEKTFYVNHTGTMNVARFAESIGAFVIYTSTLGIFSGHAYEYTETDTPSPINIYSMSKYYGELALSKILERAYILRLGWLFGGGSEHDKKFIGKIAQMHKAGFKISAIKDVYGSPLYAIDAAETIYKIILRDIPFGIYNIGGSRASRYDFACEFINQLDINADINAITFSEYHMNNKTVCEYPKCEVANTHRAFAHNILPERTWQDSLKDYAERYFK